MVENLGIEPVNVVSVKDIRFESVNMGKVTVVAKYNHCKSQDLIELNINWAIGCSSLILKPGEKINYDIHAPFLTTEERATIDEKLRQLIQRAKERIKQFF